MTSHRQTMRLLAFARPRRLDPDPHRLDGDPAAIVAHPRQADSGRSARRPMRRLRLAAGLIPALGAAALAAVLVIGNAEHPAPDSGRPADGTSRPATMLLAAAARETGKTSFRIRLSSTISDGKSLDQTEHYVGAFDPVSHTGYLRGTDFHLELRIIGGDYYVLRDGWRKVGRSLSEAIGLVGPRGSSCVDALTVDPDELLDTLRNLGEVRHVRRSGGGAQAVDTYSFAYRMAGDDSVAAHTVSGTVQVRADSNLITRVAQETTLTGASPEIADRDPVTFRMVAELFDHGTRVDVQRPAAGLAHR
jgi:hypothetical protein